jgi:PAS domain S-box-containing protein
MGSWELVVADGSLKRLSVMDALSVVQVKKPDIPFIIMLERLEEDLVLDAIGAGAHDFVIKGNLQRFVPTLERQLARAVERSNRRELQTAIRRGKMEWEAAFDAGSDLIIMADMEGKIIRCNRRVITYFSCNYREVLGKQVTRLFYGDEPAESRIFASSAARPNEVNEEDVTFPRLGGWFNVTSYPMLFEGRPYGMVHIVKDITLRRRAEEEKKLSERELLTLYAIAFRLNSTLGFGKVMRDLLAQLHIMLEIDSSAIYRLERGELRLSASMGVSRGFAAAIRNIPGDTRWLGQVLTGRHYQAAVPGDELPPGVAAAVSAMGMQSWCAIPLKLGDEITGMMLIAHRNERLYADREIFLFQSIASQMAVLIENHTLYRKMKEKTRELQRSREELQNNLQDVRRANIELGRLHATKKNFIGMASHELKTPITSILGGVDFLINYSSLTMTAEQRKIFDSVYEGVLQLKDLVEDLLSFSRVEMSGPLEKHPLDLLGIAREVRGTYSLALSTRQLTVDVAGEQLPVPGDERFCRLAVRNLLENAIKFTPDKGSIVITGRRVGRDEVLGWERSLQPFYPDFPRDLATGGYFYLLDVNDSGIGIPPAERQRVFDKFYGVGDIAYHSSGKTEFMAKGSGLGLAIVKGIMESHGGLVWDAPGPDGVGTVFSLLFPLEEQTVTPLTRD